ncbi:MAG: DUF308 domain-containing protein [Candidatus Promineofilum sp.]|nr:DUF308 domain-containing protein [Promineifilum sp.]MCW5864453.1 DUF308 domain-containing protein [Anaerolineae bacterium]
MTAKGTAANSNTWIWTLLRGVIALGLGIFLIVGGETARTTAAYVVLIYVTIAGGMQTFSGLFNRRAPGSTTDRIRGLVGLLGGLVMLVLLYFNVLTLSTAFIIIAILVIAFGLLGLFEVFFDRGGDRFRVMPVLVNVLLVALGALVFYSSSREGFDLQLWTGLVLVILGAIVGAYAYFVQKPQPQLASNDI